MSATRSPRRSGPPESGAQSASPADPAERRPQPVPRGGGRVDPSSAARDLGLGVSEQPVPCGERLEELVPGLPGDVGRALPLVPAAGGAHAGCHEPRQRQARSGRRLAQRARCQRPARARQLRDAPGVRVTAAGASRQVADGAGDVPGVEGRQAALRVTRGGDHGDHSPRIQPATAWATSRGRRVLADRSRPHRVGEQGRRRRTRSRGLREAQAGRLQLRSLRCVDQRCAWRRCRPGAARRRRVLAHARERFGRRQEGVLARRVARTAATAARMGSSTRRRSAPWASGTPPSPRRIARSPQAGPETSSKPRKTWQP